MMRRVFVLLAATAICGGVPAAAPAEQPAWTPQRIRDCLAAIDKLKAEGLMTARHYARKRAMLEARLKGTFKPTALSNKPGDPNMIQNGGFEEINRNSAPNRSRWLWWGGWSWGGEYENFWATGANKHSGKYAAGVRCKGARGRIGLSTPNLPILPGVKEYKLTFWAKGEGDNQLFVNFEGGCTGTLRQAMPPQWREVTVVGKPKPGAKDFMVYFYSIGGGTLYLDDVRLIPVGLEVK